MGTNHPNTNTSLFLIDVCVQYYPSLYSFLIYAGINFLLLPLYCTVLYVGFKQWQQHSNKSHIGNSDVLTYNLVLIEIIGSFGAVIFTAGSWAKYYPAINLSFCFLAICYVGQTLFHCEICFDRYLAVAHPLKYRNLKEVKAVRIRNVCIVLTWCLCLSWISLVLSVFPDFPGLHFLILKGIFNVIVSFCCFSALCVLMRPGPNGKKLADKSKLRAFYIILTITCLLYFQFFGFLVYLGLYVMAPLKMSDLCLTLTWSILLVIPANAMIPLLFLHRMKKLTCLKIAA